MSDKPVNALSPAHRLNGSPSVGNENADNVVQFNGQVVTRSDYHVSASGHHGSKSDGTVVVHSSSSSDINNSGSKSRSNSHSPTPPLPNDLDSQLPPITSLARINSDTLAKLKSNARNSSQFTTESLDNFSAKDLFSKSDLTPSTESSDGSFSSSTDDSDGHSIDQDPSGLTSKGSQESPVTKKSAFQSKPALEPIPSGKNTDPVLVPSLNLSEDFEKTAPKTSSSDDFYQLRPLSPPRYRDPYDSEASTFLNSRTPSTTSTARWVNPTKIKIDTESTWTPLKWMAGGLIAGAAVGAAICGGIAGAVGTVAVPGFGTVVGAVGGALAGAAFGAVPGLVGGFFFGLYKMAKDSQNGHINAALKRFENDGCQFTDSECDNLLDSGISEKDWQDLLHVPAEYPWSRSDQVVASKADRQLIREALIMAMAKTGDGTGQRLMLAHQMKARLLETSEGGVRGYSVLKAEDPSNLDNLEPARVWSKLAYFDLEPKLRAIGPGALGSYRELIDKYPLEDTEKARLNSISMPDLLTLTAAPKTSKRRHIIPDAEDRNRVRQALLLCAAREGEPGPNGYAQALSLRAALKDRHTIGIQGFRVPHGRGSPYRATTHRGYVVLRNAEAWSKLEAGKSGTIDFAEVTQEDVDDSINDLIDLIDQKGVPYLKRPTDKQYRYAKGSADAYLRWVLGYIGDKLDPALTPVQRHEALQEAAMAAGGLRIRTPQDLDQSDWDFESVVNHARGELRRQRFKSSALIKTMRSWGSSRVVARRHTRQSHRLENAKEIAKFLGSQTQIISPLDARVRRMVLRVMRKIEPADLRHALRTLTACKDGKHTAALRKKVIELLDVPHDGPEKAGVILILYFDRVMDSRHDTEVDNQNVSHLSEDAALEVLMRQHDIKFEDVDAIGSGFGSGVDSSDWSQTEISETEESDY